MPGCVDSHVVGGGSMTTREVDTLVWVTGGTSGIGDALVRNVPFAHCRTVNIARRERQDVVNFRADLADRSDWQRLRQHLAEEFARFAGRRAVFVHNAVSFEGTGMAGSLDPVLHDRHVLVNAAAPLVVGEAFLAACPAHLDAGLIMLSSTASTAVYPGRASYSAGKAAVEQWVRVVAAERSAAGVGPWVVAVLPGTVDTPALREAAAADESVFPNAPALRAAYASGQVQTTDEVARGIWALVDDGPSLLPVVRVGPSIAPVDDERDVIA